MRINTLIIFLSASLISLQAPSYAQTNETRQFTENHGIEVNKALQAINVSDYQTALTILDKTLKEHQDLNSYEKSTIFQMKGLAYHDLKQPGKATKAFENSIRAGGLLESENSAICKNLAHIRIINSEHKHAVELLKACQGNDDPLNPIYSEFILQVCVKVKNYECALPYAESWFKDANPKERYHYDSLNFLYGKLKMNDKQIKIVKEMIEHWPNDKSLSDSLVAINANNGQDRDITSNQP